MLDLRDVKTAVKQLTMEKGFPENKIWEIIELAIARAYKKEHLKKGEIIRAKIDQDTGSVKFYKVMIVVDSEMLKDENDDDQDTYFDDEESIDNPDKKIRFNPDKHIMLEEAKTTHKNVSVLDEIVTPLEADETFTRIAAQSAKQTIIQEIRELEKNLALDEFKDKENELVSGTIQRIENNNVYVNLGKASGLLFAKEALPNESFRIGERKKFLALGMKEAGGTLMILLSRTHPSFVEKLLAIEVPELQEKIVEIMATAREPGFRTKIAVKSNNDEIDPVGACIGPKGVRINALADEIPSEKIDVIEYSEEPAKFVGNALSPVTISETEIIPESREIKVYVDPNLLSAAIGKNGQNVRLASKLTG
ncbi:MAG TPA: transcription termination factor NusA [Candidatus Paceibacterota bacterium]|nr:transcription termination factor NusA [Candidatus Paceibacterota bacterium]HRZ29276.1 transcription termination factor NusA [Candidatus Paceibacterota bacterium]